MTKAPSLKIRNLDTRTHRLAEAGYQWKETNQGVQITGWTIMGFSSFAFLLAWAIAGMRNGSDAASVLMLIGFGMLLVGHMIGNVWAHRMRSIIFEATGPIRAPQGLPLAMHVTELGCRVDEISNIELDRSANGQQAVSIISIEGDTVLVAHNLLPDTARKVAVQLTRALDDLRLSLAEGHMSAYAAADPRLARKSAQHGLNN